MPYTLHTRAIDAFWPTAGCVVHTVFVSIFLACMLVAIWPEHNFRWHRVVIACTPQTTTTTTTSPSNQNETPWANTINRYSLLKAMNDRINARLDFCFLSFQRVGGRGSSHIDDEDNIVSISRFSIYKSTENCTVFANNKSSKATYGPLIMSLHMRGLMCGHLTLTSVSFAAGPKSRHMWTISLWFRLFFICFQLTAHSGQN